MRASASKKVRCPLSHTHNRGPQDLSDSSWNGVPGQAVEWCHKTPETAALGMRENPSEGKDKI